MQFLYDDLPIVACSTSLSENAAIGLIRLSGFDSLSSLSPFFKKDISSLSPNLSVFTSLLNGSEVVDEVVITFFKGPNSYNGENILEISAHGNILNLKRIISLFVNSGMFRLAKNGEFTYRALKNKKLSLSQVEGLDLFLNASSSLMLDQGMKLLHGDLFKKYQGLYDAYLKLKSAIEINIDFAEDVGEEQSALLLKNSVSHLGNLIATLQRSATVSKKSFMSPNVIIVGEPNAGKSSLFNNMLLENRAIVSSTPGTTRDFITEYIEIGGNNFKLIDTAGLRFTTDSIEEEGIKRATTMLADSFFKMLVVDINSIEKFSFNFSEEIIFDLLILNHADIYAWNKHLEPLLGSLPKFKNIIIVSVEKNILFFDSKNSGPMGANFGISETGSIGPKSESGSMEPLKIDGSIGSIGPVINSFIEDKFVELKALDPIIVDRHRDLINVISDSYGTFSCNISSLSDMAIISSECEILGRKIAELIGIVSPDDVLGNIFSNFCIGK